MPPTTHLPLPVRSWAPFLLQKGKQSLRRPERARHELERHLWRVATAPGSAAWVTHQLPASQHNASPPTEAGLRFLLRLMAWSRRALRPSSPRCGPCEERRGRSGSAGISRGKLSSMVPRCPLEGDSQLCVTYFVQLQFLKCLSPI